MVKVKQEVIWQPQPGPQTRLVTCPVFEVFFGGARGTTAKAAEKPAWEQDFEAVSERAGRRQDKEQVMARLRDLGYM